MMIFSTKKKKKKIELTKCLCRKKNLVKLKRTKEIIYNGSSKNAPYLIFLKLLLGGNCGHK